MPGLTGRCRAALAGALLLLCAPAAKAEHIVLESYQEREGLTDLTPNCLVQDQRTMLWICTENGLFRFDGFRMRREALPPEAGGRIVAARVDRGGRLWVGAEGGLFIRHDEAGSTRWLPVRKPDGKRLVLPRSQQLDWDDDGTAYLMDRGNRLWKVAPSQAGATAAVAQPLALPPQPGGEDTGVLAPVRWQAGTLWFGCGAGLCAWRDGRLAAWGAAQGLPADGWANLLVARDGSLWARSPGRLAHLAGGAARFEAVRAPAISGYWISSVALLEDRAGALLTSTDHGVARWDGRAWREWTDDNGLPDSAIRVLLFDAEGSLWLGAGGRGVHRWVGYGLADHWTRAQGLPSNVVIEPLQDASGRLWVVTREGVAWFDEAARRFVVPPVPGPARVRSWRLAKVVDGDLWWIENDRLYTVKAGSTAVRLVARDPALADAVQGPGGYYTFGPEQVERLVPTAAGLRRERVGPVLPGRQQATAVVGDERSAWFLSDGQVFHWRDGAWAVLRDERGAPVPAYLDLAPDAAGGLWAFDGTGVRHYALAASGARLLRQFPPALFGGAAAYFVRSAADGRTWIGTDQGVFILDPDGRWQHLHRGNGLVWNDVDPGFLVDAQGQAWISTSAGVTRLHAGAQLPQPPVLRVDQVEFGSQLFAGPPPRPVPWADRRLRVTLGTASFSTARSLRIEYRLRPDMPWRTAESPVLEVGALEAGVQLLQVRAAGQTPAEAAGPVLSMPFEVRPPWWNTTAARLAGGVLLALLWWASSWAVQRRSRARRLALEQAIAERTAELETSREALRRLGEHNARGLEEERKRVSRELHDEFGQQLAALRMEVSVARKRAAGGAVAPEHLDHLLVRLDQLVATMRSLVSQLRPPALDGGLTTALRWLAGESMHGIQVRCEVPAGSEAGELSPDLATMVFRIAQESLNNVRRHAQASHATVRLTRDGDQWMLTVRDDGIGFDPAQRRHGYGVLGMEERARLLGGQLEVDSALGRGTEVRLRFTAPAGGAA